MKYANKKRLAALTLAITASIASVGFAAEEQLDEFAGEEYVVTATKTKLEAKEVPQAVEVITQEQIQNIGAITVQDALRQSSSVEVSDVGMTGNRISMRGGSNSDVLILLNGHRMPTEGSGGTVVGNSYLLSGLSAANIERIEILRGGAGALYGSEARSGVINIITKKSEKASATIGLETGSKSMSNYYHLDSGKVGKFSATFDANFAKDRYYVYKASQNSGSVAYGPKQIYSMDMDYKFNDNNKLNFFMNYEKTNQEKFFVNSSGMFGPYTGVYKTDRRNFALTYDSKMGKHDVQLSGTYGFLKKDSTAGMSYSPNPKPSHSEYKTWTVNAKDSVNVDKNNRITFGAEYITEGRKDASMDARNRQYAYYAQDELRIGNKLLLIPAVRLNRTNEYGNHYSPSIGGTYSFNDKSRFKASWGKAFRSPCVYELYGVMSMFGEIGNPNLKPETSKNYEFAYEQEFDKYTNAKLTYFHSNKKDAIELDGSMSYVPGKGLVSHYQYVNKDRVVDKGVEFELKRQINKGLTLTANYNWLQSLAEGDSGWERNEYKARNTFKLTLGWVDPAKTGWSAEVWNKWYYRYLTDNGDKNLSTLNFVVTKRWGDKCRAFFGIDNLFNTEVIDMYEDGRTWRAGVEWTF